MVVGKNGPHSVFSFCLTLVEIPLVEKLHLKSYLVNVVELFLSSFPQFLLISAEQWTVSYF